MKFNTLRVAARLSSTEGIFFEKIGLQIYQKIYLTFNSICFKFDLLFLAQRCCKKKSTQSHKVDIRHGGHTKKKNEDQFNLSSCLLWFLGGFVFEDSLAKKTKI
jgi:hypothetical protein